MQKHREMKMKMKAEDEKKVDKNKVKKPKKNGFHGYNKCRNCSYE